MQRPQESNQHKSSRQNPEHAQSMFEKALALHQQGAILEARGAYLEILKIQSQHFDSKHLLGVTYIQTGETETAYQLISDAIKINPHAAFAHNNLGKVLKDLNRQEDALTAFNLALSLTPNYPEALNNRGNILIELGRLDDALQSYDQALTLKPDYPAAWSNKGRTLKDLHLFDQALSCFDQALTLCPNLIDALRNRSKTLVELNRFDEALACIDKAISAHPVDAEAIKNRGLILLKLKRPEAALISFEQALALEPKLLDAMVHRSAALLELKRPDEALQNIEAVLHISPELPDAHFILGNILQKLGRFEESCAAFDTVIRAEPDNAAAHAGKGNAFISLKKISEGLRAYDEALILKPDEATIRFNKSLALLLSGNFQQGWKEYESRWDSNPLTPKRKFAASTSPWLGQEPLQGKTILIYAEQGLGDCIQFSRYIKYISQLGAKVIFEVPAPLSLIFSDLEGVNELVPVGNTLPEFDYHCPLLSLPLAFGTTLETIPGTQPYLHANDVQVLNWAERLGSHGFRIGICWQGSTADIDEGRSFRLEQFEKISQIPEVRLISLHKGAGESQLADISPDMNVEILGTELDKDGAFVDTAAIMMHCDLIITSDTSIAHLAGALGVPVYVILKAVPDWRWMLDRSDSPWYPNMQLFRQKLHGDWDGVFAELEIYLKQQIISKGTT